MKRIPSNSNPFTTHPRIRVAFADGANFSPVHLADARVPSEEFFPLLAIRYETSEGEIHAEAWPDGKPPEKGHRFQLVSQTLRRRGKLAIQRIETRSAHFRATKELTLAADRPWLKIRCTIVSTGAPIRSEATRLHVPALYYSSELENPLESDQYDFSFGRILPGGYEQPPYLTFWRKGRRAGVLLWTENREAMRQIAPRDEWIEGIHPSLNNASSDLNNPEWDEKFFRKTHSWEFYLWPVRAREWRAATEQLRSMRFRSWNPKRIVFPPAVGVHSRDGLRLSADEAAAANRRSISKSAADGRWWHILGPRGRSLLYAQDTQTTKPLRVRHALRGRYRIWITVNGGSGVKLRDGNAPYPIPFTHDPSIQGHPYYNALLKRSAPAEVDAGVWSLRGGTIELRPHTAIYEQTIVGGIRFEPVPAPAARSGGTDGREVFLSGIADSPDIAQGDGTPTDEPYRANVAEHARLGFRRVYWRADGQCCDFHTHVGTVRYPVRRTHSVFNPSTLPYGHALRKYDLLSAAVDEAHDCGIEIYGYMRINGFGGNVTPQFFIDHPELRDERELGGRSPRMCFYLPAFRKWKVEIAREIVRHGVHGLLIDLTRTPPMVEYHPEVVKAYEAAFRAPPPRNWNRGYVSYGIHPLETGEEWIRWWKFRAEGFTRFGRELRAMLAEEGKPKLPIHVQVRPRMALYDGLDLPAWTNEGLIDLLNVWPTAEIDVPQEIFDAAGARVPVRCTVVGVGNEQNEAKMWQVLKDARFQGLTIYESNGTVWSSHWRGVVERILQGA